MKDKKIINNGLSRRDFLKVSALAGAGLQVAGFAGAGLSAGKDKTSYTGWESSEGLQQTFNRKKYELDEHPYKPVGPTRRPDKNTEYIFGRQDIMMKKLFSGWNQSKGIDALGEPLASFYKKDPEAFKLDMIRFTQVFPKARQDKKKYGEYFALADAFSAGWGEALGVYPVQPEDPPEVSDYQGTHPMTGKPQPIRKPIPFKSPDHAAKLIKRMAHLYGATIVGVCKLNPDWCYANELRGGKPGPFEVPKHWTYAIAVGVPHEWDQFLSNPAHGTSFDAYNRASRAAGRLEAFIKNIGYPARSHTPGTYYDLMAVPILVDAGIGQLGRHGCVICPETGSNLRVAIVTTNVPMTVDKPIDFGVTEFCNGCKICAEYCPSGSISFADSPKGMVMRGYEHWRINTASCLNFWMQAMGPIGCRLCIAVCPYSRKDNWMHKISKTVDINDPTGLVNDALTWMQKSWFKGPKAEEYLPPPDGRFAGFRAAPDYLDIEKWFDVKVTNPQKGE